MKLDEPIRLGISSCLLGQPVRWDGAAKRDPFLVETLGRWVDWVPVCPEVETGFGVPRPPMRLVGDSTAPRLVVTATGEDVTERMTAWAAGRLEELAREDLCGFVFKKDSPSSGMERVRVYPARGVDGVAPGAVADGAAGSSPSAGGPPARRGVGIFAGLFMRRFPLLPVEEEGRLHDPVLRENFVERVFTLRRWRAAMAECATLGGVVDFHTRHKLLVYSHSTAHYREMGRLVAHGAELPFDDLRERYQRLLMEALRLIATPPKHRNVLQHIMGYFKLQLTSDEKRELLEVIDAFAAGDVPLIVPVTLLNHYARREQQEYLLAQYYLHPHPLELRLRNHG